MRSVQDRCAPGEQLAQKKRSLPFRKRGIKEVKHQLGKELEAPSPVWGSLEIRPVAQKDGLEAVDEQIDVAKRVEVLSQGVGQRRAHAVQPLHGFQERPVTVRNRHLLHGTGDVRA
ncbi:MAG: hypothetical protein A2W26_12230 [Acidobacteria bacterium RBG_16_64_8]|nr:MAG: hypothetical protein A2W26_12230 [Acidobacteria bacterium RBG_16_64_8]